MKLETVWVPRGYFSRAKIKDDDVQMIIFEDLGAWISQFIEKGENNEDV